MREINKLKLFIDNILVYGIGTIIQMLIPFAMIPVVTRLIPDTGYYGAYELSTTCITYGSYFALFGMYDAMYRLFFEDEGDEYRKNICHTTLSFTRITSLAMLAVTLLANRVIAGGILGDGKYGVIVCIAGFSIFANICNIMMAGPSRMQNKRGEYVAINTLTPILLYSVAIPLILGGHYMVALPLGTLVSYAVPALIFWFINKDWFYKGHFDRGYFVQMLRLALPLVPGIAAYWLFASCDRVMISRLLGIGEAGVYSIGSKLGQASQLIYAAFNAGWQYFAFSTMKERGQVQSNSMLFEYMCAISLCCSMFVFALCKPIYQLLFVGDYVRGYIVSPYLFLSPLVMLLLQVATNQLMVVKRTSPNVLVLGVGAVVDVALNLVLIPRLGIEGAAIATLSAYVVSLVVCVMVLAAMGLMVVNVRLVAMVLLMCAYVLQWRFLTLDAWWLCLLAAIACCGVALLMYRRDVTVLLSRLRDMGKNAVKGDER